MLQQTSIYQQIKVGEAVRMFASYYRNPRDANTLISLVGLDTHSNSFFSSLSGGQKQRLSLALALVGNPRLVFLDEPTSAMDPQGRIQTWGLIRSLREAGITVLLTTHYMEEAQRLADRVAIIDHGKLVALGTPEELVGASNTDVITFSISGAIDIASLQNAMQPDQVQVERAGVYVVYTSDALEAAGRLNAWRRSFDVAVSDLRVTGASLEDVFLKLTGSEYRD
jgi:ABC-2 type transport system ATP-binding protein